MNQSGDESLLIENNVDLDERRPIINHDSNDKTDVSAPVQVNFKQEESSTTENCKQKSKHSAKNSHSDIKQMNVRNFCC